MHKDEFLRLHTLHIVEQPAARGVGAQREFIQLAAPAHGTAARVERHLLAFPGSTQTARRRFRIRVADEHAMRGGILEDFRGKDIGQGVLRHHSAGNGINCAREHGQLRDVASADHFHGQAFGQFEVAVTTRRAAAQTIGDRRDLGAQPPDIKTKAAAQRAALFRFIEQS